MLKDGKLIQLMRFWPDGAVFTSSWLIHEKGYSKGLLQRYVKSGWIELIANGAYRRIQLDENGRVKPLKWHGGVYALQGLSQWKGFPPIHVAALSALELQGYAHYLSVSNQKRIWLFADPNNRVPTWFKNYKWQEDIKIYSPSLFTKNSRNELSQKDWGPYVTLMSCPERAILEMLELCPKHESIEHAKLVMEGLTTLRPKLVSILLKHCKSVKVKRLFLALADICNHQWLSQVDTSKVELGTGKRILAPGQALHPKYLISIPRKTFEEKEEI